MLLLVRGGENMSNPVFKKMSGNEPVQDVVIDGSNIMTINGTLQITACMGLLLLASAAYVWSRFSLGYTDQVTMLTGGGALVGFILAMIICFARTKVLVPFYAICEGLFLGGLSAVFEASYPGIVRQAVAGTFAAFFSMLFLYRTGVIRCSEKFRSVIFISTMSVLVIYLVDFIGHFFGHAVPLINTSTTFGIVFSLIVVAIAALNLILDFDFIEQGAKKMLPKDYEWYGAFGLMVTVVWLYVEILKLLAKLSDRR